LASSWDWVWKGVCGDWKVVCRFGFGRGYTMRQVIDLWGAVLIIYFSRPARDGPHLRGV